MSKKRHVLLGMSGGLDSSVAALMLKEDDYKVTGLTLRTYDYISNGCIEKQSGCCTIDSIYDAKNLMESLSFDHLVIDIRQEFNNLIIRNFINEYLEGRTPNPCVLCNTLIKWAYMMRKADELGCEYIATGHYARIRKKANRFILVEGTDETKDQSYFLWGLTQEMLARTIFPLGSLRKTQVREYAQEYGLKSLAEKRESQEICFIDDDDYHRFLVNNVPDFSEKYKPGNIINSDGKILGQHKGYPFYTIGQRKGLEVAVGHPLYVTEIRPATNEVVLDEREKLIKKELVAKELNLIKYEKLPGSLKVNTKIRYRSKAIPSIIKQMNDKMIVNFEEDVYGITAGQSAVFYEDKDVVGGGIISTN